MLNVDSLAIHHPLREHDSPQVMTTARTTATASILAHYLAATAVAP